MVLTFYYLCSIWGQHYRNFLAVVAKINAGFYESSLNIVSTKQSVKAIRSYSFSSWSGAKGQLCNHEQPGSTSFAQDRTNEVLKTKYFGKQ